MSEQNLYESIIESLPEGAERRVAWLALIRCFSSIERVLLKHFAQKYNSSLPRYDVLTALALNRGGLTMGELATMLMVTKGNITGVVRRLLQDGLVLKKASKSDRRVQSVKISAKGVRLWEKMHADYDVMIGQLMEGQSAEQVQELLQALRRTRRLAEKNSAAFNS